MIFAGTGPDLPLVEAAVAKYPHVHYKGFIRSRAEIARWYASTELGLALSGWETFGLSIMEALASGQAIVGANIGAAAEHVEDGQCGYSVTPGDVDELVNAVCQFADSDDKGLLSQNARTYAKQFSWSKTFEKELSLYMVERGNVSVLSSDVRNNE